MKKVFIGLALGVVLCGIAGFLVMPGVRQASYQSGYDAGNKNGLVTGTAAGIAQGIAQMEASQKRGRDSVAVAEKQREAILRARLARKPRKVIKEQQNWHVIDGKIADPI